MAGVNDWSARDIQAWEYVPLGPNLAKSFATSLSAWVTPLAALEAACIPLPAQQPEVLPYLTVNGASLRAGDLYASGTISGPAKEQRGSLLELSWGGAEPWDTSGRTFLRDGDDVVMRYSAPGALGRIGLGDVRARILPAVA